MEKKPRDTHGYTVNNSLQFTSLKIINKSYALIRFGAQSSLVETLDLALILLLSLVFI